MKIYWSFKDVPELSPLSPPERRVVHRACYGRAFKSRRCLAALLVCGLCSGLGSAAGSSVHLLFGLPFSIWHMVICGGIGGGSGGFIFGHVATEYLRPFYADYIRTELRRIVS